MIRPIYIFSLPRSGSTLLQRILSGCPEIKTVPEPWVLLPVFYALKKDCSYSEYGHDVLVDALEDFCSTLPNGIADYRESVQKFAIDLYEKASKDKASATYFLDKTPRYHLIADEIICTFPDAKFIFLWRNPLSVVSSIINTWGVKGQWNLHASKVDLYLGLDSLTNAYKKHKDKAISVCYEDLVVGDSEEWGKLFAYLELPFNEAYLKDLGSRTLNGRMGDPTGATEYQSLSASSKEKWRTELSNPVRKVWCRYYLSRIGAERLSIMGYDKEYLLKCLLNSKVSFKHTITDIIGLTYDVIYTFFEPKIIRDKFVRALKGMKNVGHH